MSVHANQSDIPPASKTVQFGDVRVPVTDPHSVQPVVVDLMIEAREFNGVVALSFATLQETGDGQFEAFVCSRIRLSLATASDLRGVLDGVLAKSMPQGEAH